MGTTTEPTRATIIRRALTACALAVLLAGFLGQQAGAVKNQPYRTISKRTQIQLQNCKDAGGVGEATYTYGSRTNGHQVISSKTTCSGGERNGYTCVNTKEETNCNTAMMPVEQTTGADSATDTAGVHQTDAAELVQDTTGSTSGWSLTTIDDDDQP